MATAHVVAAEKRRRISNQSWPQLTWWWEKTLSQQPNMATAHVEWPRKKDAESATKHGHSSRGGRGKKTPKSATKYGHSTRGGRGKKTPNQQPNMATAHVVAAEKRRRISNQTWPLLSSSRFTPTSCCC